MSRADYLVSKRITGEEPPKKALLFALFSHCSQTELDALSWLYSDEIIEWKKHENEPRRSQEQNLKELGL